MCRGAPGCRRPHTRSVEKIGEARLLTDNQSTAEREATSSPSANADREVLSDRLLLLLDDILAGQAPNAGRFCGYCYHPLSPEREVCTHCGRSTSEQSAAAAIPRAVIDMHRRRRGREGLVVRTIAWGGLTVGVIVALLPFVFGDVSWWTVAAFFGLLAFFYLLSANLANSLGDSLGYRWGQSLVRREWARFIRERDAQTNEEPSTRRM